MRDRCLDVIKALAIIMMVAFHARAPKAFSSFGYLFHIGVFFVVSGWFFDFQCSERLMTCVAYVKKKMVRLWFPVVFWSFLGVLFHNLLLDWNIISDCGMDTIVDVDFVSEKWSSSQLVRQLTYVPFMVADGSQLCGAFWFLQSLFFVTTGYCVASWFLSLLRINVLVSQTVVSLILLFVARYANVAHVGYIGGSHTLTAYALLHMGVLFRRFGLNIQKLRGDFVAMIGILCFLLLLVLRSQGRISLATNSYPSCLFLLVCTSCGYFLLNSVAAFIPDKIGLLLAYVGQRTMPILILHFAAFKLVNVVLVWWHHAPWCRTAEFPVTYSGGCYWIVYLIVGITAPLLLYELYGTIKRMRPLTSIVSSIG